MTSISLTNNQRRILQYLKRVKAASVSEVSAMVDVDEQSLPGILGSMADESLIKLERGSRGDIAVATSKLLEIE